MTVKRTRSFLRNKHVTFFFEEGPHLEVDVKLKGGGREKEELQKQPHFWEKGLARSNWRLNFEALIQVLHWIYELKFLRADPFDFYLTLKLMLLVTEPPWSSFLWQLREVTRYVIPRVGFQVKSLHVVAVWFNSFLNLPTFCLLNGEKEPKSMFFQISS